MGVFLLVLLILTTGVPLAHSERSPACRCLASDDCWPDAQAWMAFNSSVNGRLIAVRPPASPCHDPHYDSQACQEAVRKWSFPFWRADQPGAMQGNNWEADGDHGCSILANRTVSCSQGAVPVYAMNVTQAFDVQMTVRFASKHNLRLVIRNTGHDYLGRSAAVGALSIWMHHLKDITFHESFTPDGCYQGGHGSSAVTVGAGVQWEELYQAVFDHNSVIVGAGCSSVGAAGGYSQGGGHSLLSPAFGLSADNILQFQVVTANGKLVTANRCQNQDLFWALRGGAGGTFGVVVSATHRTHPALDNLVFASYNITAKDRSSFQKFLTRFIEIHPSLSDAGWSGYFSTVGQSITLQYLLPNRNISFANKSLAPLLRYVQHQQGVEVDGGLQTFPSFQAWHLQIQCGGQQSCLGANGSFGIPTLLSSRLIPRSTFESTPSQLTEALINVLDLARAVIVAFVAGGQVTKPQDSAVNPAWREALWLVIIPASWSDNGIEAERQAAERRVTTANKLLIDITPGSGTYLNEADVNEPDWQQSCFGDHYHRLYEIKQQVDPTGLFVCRHCVGSEDWSEDLNCKIK